MNAQCNLLCNTDFEDNQVTSAGSYVIVDASLISCWNTTAADNNIEVWGSGFGGVPSYSGNQFLELNAYMVSTMYQNFTTAPGVSLSISFAHRGRSGVDVLSVDIGPVGGPYTTLGNFSDGNTAWGYYTVNYIIPGGVGNNFSLRFNSVSAAGGNPAIGNFLDAISVNLPYNIVSNPGFTNPACGATNGTATVNPVNGTSPYIYSWSTSPSQTTQAITGLSAGTYTVTVTDLNGCINTDSVTLVAHTPPTVEVTGPLNPLCDSTKLNWASWGTVNGTSGAGTISSDLSVLVTKPSGGLSTTGGMFNGGVFPTQYNVPSNNTAIRNDLAGLFTFCFNRPVINPQIALSSIGSGGNSVQINTSVPYQVIWQGIGMSYPNNTAFIGTEGYTIIQFPGLHTCISFDYLQSESYCNLAFGTLDTNCQSLVSPPQCGGGADTLTASGAVTYSWSPTTGLNTSTGAVVIASPLVTTTYYVTGTDANSCTDTDSITVTVIALPTITLTGDTVICLGDSTTLTASGGGTYLWSPGNSTDSIIKVSPTADITYTVVVTNSGGCSDSSSINIVVKPLPQALFNLNPVCKNASMIFNDASLGGAVNWKWHYGDGTVSALQNSIYTYATCGTFNAKLVVTTDDGCKDSTTKTARVYCLPLADFSFVDECLNQPMNFTDLSAVSGDTVSVWSWDFGDTSPLSTVQNSAHAYTNSGPFAVSLIATSNNGCKDTVVKNVNVFPLPVITLTGDTLICLGDSTTLTAQGGATYLWTPGNFTDSIIKVSPNATTVYAVTVVSADGCIDSASINVIVKPLPQALFNLTPVCKNAAMIFNDASTGSILNRNWNYGDGTLSTLQNSTYTYATCDTFSVKLVVTTIDGCLDSITKTAKVYCLPVADYSFTEVCLNQVMNFTDLSAVSGDTVSGWSWNFGDGSALSSIQNASRTFTSEGAHNVSLIATSNNGCKDTVIKSVNVHPLPVSKFSTTNVCDGTVVPFTDQSTILAPDLIQSWEWNFGDGSPVFNNQTTSHPYSSIGSYTAKLVVVSNFGCADSITKTVIIHPNPTVNFTATDTSGCAPLCISFLDQSSITLPSTIMQWEWNVGDGSAVSYSQNFDHCFTNLSVSSAEYYSIILTVTSDSGCFASMTKNSYISVFPNPVADFYTQPTKTSFLAPLVEIIDASAGADFWTWDFGDQTISSLSNPGFHTYADTGTYIVSLITSTQYGCSDTAYKTVVIEPDFVFYIPNAFSPNNDIHNKTFSGKGLYIREYEMMIFDRWGNLIFFTDDINKPWDGRINNDTELAERDVYVYSIKIIDIKKDQHFYKGIVTLLR